MKNSFFEILAQHYNSCLSEPLTKEQTEALNTYLDTGDKSLMEKLPEIDKRSTNDDPVDFIKKQKKETLVMARYLYLIYGKNGQESFNYLLKRAFWFDHYGITASMFWNPDSPLDVIHRIDFALYDLDDQIHGHEIIQCKKTTEGFLEANPATFDELIAKGSMEAKRRALAFLYLKDTGKYGPMLDRFADEYSADVDRRGIEGLFNACALCEFKHTKLNEKFVEYFKKSPATVIDLLEFNKDFYPEFMDEKFNKDYDTRKSAPAVMNYAENMTKFLGVEDFYLLKGIYEECSHYYMKDVITWFRKYPVELVLEVFKNLTEGEEMHAYRYASVFVDFWNILDAMGTDKIPIFKIIESRFDEFVSAYMEYMLDMDSDNSDFSDYFEEAKAYFIDGDRKLLKKFASKEHFLTFNTISTYNNIHEFAGLLAGYAPLASKARLIAQFVGFTGQAYNLAHIVKGAIKAYNWNAETLNNYFVEAFENDFVDAWGIIVFYDEILLPDTERRPKEVQYITQAMSDMFVPYARNFINQHEETVLEYYDFIGPVYDFGLLYAHYTDNPGANPAPLIEFLKHKNKTLRTKALKYLPSYPAARPEVEELLNAKRKDIREFAEKALAGFENINAVSLDGKGAAVATGDFDIAGYVKKNMPKNWQKTIGFTAPEHWPKVRKAATEDPAELDYVICYICTYAANKDMQKMLYPEKMRPYFNENDLKELSLQLFDEWIKSGADNKTKGFMTLVGIHGGVEGIQKLKDIIPEFINLSRSAIAGDAVKAMAVSNSTISLVAVDNMARTHRNKLVKHIANETMAAAADSLGLTVEELADKIVPNLGFDERGEMTLDTGGRKFTVRLKTNLSIELTNEEGKALKAFPASTSKDDELLYSEAKSDFSTLKKELKNLVSMQSLRLQQSLAKGKKWTKESYEELFVHNPVMQLFAMTLIFGTYKDGKPDKTFRYSGDGSYTDIDDSDFALAADADIRLVHPGEMVVADRQKWDEQLTDYELSQPFLQLARPVYDNAAVKTRTYDAFAGTYVTDYFGTKMYKAGWERDPSGDAGSYYCMYYIGTDYSACIDFDEGGICIGYTDGDSVSLGPVYFCKTEHAGVNYRNSIHDSDIIPPAEVPLPFFSEVIYMLEQGAKACAVKDDE